MRIKSNIIYPSVKLCRIRYSSYVEKLIRFRRITADCATRVGTYISHTTHFMFMQRIPSSNNYIVIFPIFRRDTNVSAAQVSLVHIVKKLMHVRRVHVQIMVSAQTYHRVMRETPINACVLMVSVHIFNITSRPNLQTSSFTFFLFFKRYRASIVVDTSIVDYQKQVWVIISSKNMSNNTEDQRLGNS